MFWKILLYVYLGFSALCLFLNILVIADGVATFKQRHPHVSTPQNKSVIKRIIGIFRLIFVCLIPLWNVLHCFIILFKWEDIVNGALEQTEDEWVAMGGVLDEDDTTNS